MQTLHRTAPEEPLRAAAPRHCLPCLLGSGDNPRALRDASRQPACRPLGQPARAAPPLNPLAPQAGTPPLCSAARRQALTASRSGATRAASDTSTNTTTVSDCSADLAAKDARIAELEAQLAAVQAFLNDTLAELEGAYAQMADVNAELYASFESVSCPPALPAYLLPARRAAARAASCEAGSGCGGRQPGPRPWPSQQGSRRPGGPPHRQLPGTTFSELRVAVRISNSHGCTAPSRVPTSASRCHPTQMAARAGTHPGLSSLPCACATRPALQGVDGQDSLHDCLVDSIGKQTQLITCTQQASPVVVVVVCVCVCVRAGRAVGAPASTACASPPPGPLPGS